MNLSGNINDKNNRMVANMSQPAPAAMPEVPSKTSEMMQKAKGSASKYTSLIVLTLALGLAFGACVLAYGEYFRIAELESTRQTKTSELEKYTSYAGYLQKLADLKDQLDTNLQLSEQAITVDFEIPQLMNQLIKMARDNEIEIESLSYAGSTTESKGTKDPGTINVQLEVLGNYSQVTNLLSMFENARRLISLKSMKYLYRGVETAGFSSNNNTAKQFVPNIELNSDPYAVTLTVTSYYLGEINTPEGNLDALDPEILNSQNASFDRVASKLGSMTWIEPTALDSLQIGTSNPFEFNPITVQDLNNPTQGINLLQPVN